MASETLSVYQRKESLGDFVSMMASETLSMYQRKESLGDFVSVCFYAYAHKVVLIKCYFIVKPTIGLNESKYKYVDNQNKLGIYTDSNVYLCDDFNGPTYGFSFTSFKDIIDKTFPENKSLDFHYLNVIGFVADVKDLKKFKTTKGKDTKKISVIIQDLEMDSIYLSLWDSYADRILEHWENRDQHGVIVVILQFATLKYFGPFGYVNSCFSVSKLFINSDIDDITSFRNSLIQNSAASSCSSQSSRLSGIFLTLYDEYVVKTEFNNIAELNLSEVKSVVIVGTVQMIAELPWYYFACKACNKKVTKKTANDTPTVGVLVDEEEIYECKTKTCKNSVIEYVQRIKIPLTVQDSSGTVSLTLFDRDACKILKTTTSNLIEKHLAGGDKGLYPDEFEALLGKKFAFKIDIKQFNIDNNFWFFCVSKLTDDEDIICELEKKATTLRFTDMDSQETVHLNDDNPIDVTMGIYVGTHSNENLKSKAVTESMDDNVITPLPKKLDGDCMENQNDRSFEAKLMRKKRKLHMAAKKGQVSDFSSTIKDIQIRSPLSNISNDGKKRRLMRKKGMDKRKSNNNLKGLQNIQLSSNKSPNNRSVIYGKEVVIPYQSIQNQHTIVTSSDIYYTPPLSDITNASITNADYTSPKFCRSIRKRYLDSKKPTYKSTSVNFQSSSTSTLNNNIQASSSNNLREEHHLNGEIITDIFCGKSKDYLDHGDQNHICETCHAKLWKDEVLRSYQRKTKSSFSLCCGYSKVKLPDFKDPPSDYKSLYTSLESKSKHFLKNIRRYNSMFSFTSMGGKVDSSINKGNSPFVFRLSGENYHTIGSLLPTNGSKPKFSQLYIYDLENEVANTQAALGQTKKVSTSSTENLDFEIIQDLKAMLDAHNELVKSYRMARDCFRSNPHINLKIRLIAKRNQDGRIYNLPTASEVAALIVGDIDTSFEPRDITVKTKEGYLQRISELHRSYLALQYPLLFVYGDDGYRIDILHRDVSTSTISKRHTCTMREYFCYRIQDRVNTFSLILNSRRLFQQFLVDAYTMIESERLLYIRTQQKKLRRETYENLCSVKNQGKSDVSKIGQHVILPSSFTGSARYMFQNYLDPMSLCKWYGYPYFFITITCNPKWPEVKRILKDTTLNPEDRPDILCRLFKMKLDSIIKDLRDHAILGKLQAVVYTVEFQKRGLPHAHLCLFMHADHKLPTVDYIDPFISAEIPDKDKDPELYSLVNGDGFPIYRRCNNGFFVDKSDVKLDNRSVVPYNKILLQRYQAHINVEWCNQAGSIKYLFKYINKGHDRASICFVPTNETNEHEKKVDEIKDYYSCRYISACEASWRIFSYDIHYRNPSVIRLPFHLPGQQHVIYEEIEEIEDVLDKPSVAVSMFLEWFRCNQSYPEARQLTYVKFPTKFVWKSNKRMWKQRKRGFSIGRIHSVSPSVGEAYYLRILLNKVKGPKTFEDIRTVNDVEYPTFRDACYAYGLLDDDNEYVEAIVKASFTGSGYYLRSLFCTMLMSEGMSRPEFVWERTFTYLSDDILYNQHLILKHPGLVLNEDQIKNLTLLEIEKFLLRNNSTLKGFQ
ncbi:uncharacterized protein LOC110893602 [Helianthus annuus]|uniref:uncharacterized protein LOC110893602 n=1 Tax=Helianthus annuus TaxID=4232 RepID=UPI000B907492|nr:uncharacterized protein LOC110893602 [Helianthus annuus]